MEPEDSDQDAVVAKPVVEPLSPKREGRTYMLLFPRKVDGTPLRKLVLRRPTQGDVDDLGAGVASSSRQLLCRLLAIDEEVLRGLDAADSEAIHSMFFDMLPAYMRKEQ